MARALTRFGGPSVGCVVLAAGEGVRFGGGSRKLTTRFDGKPLLQYAIDAVCGSAAQTCTLVVGANADDVLAAVDARRCVVARNDSWREGIASSIRRGLQRHAEDSACIFLVGDQPHVRSVDVDALVEAFRARPRGIVALRAGRVWGSPVLFCRDDFAALARLRGDHGAKRYAQARSGVRFAAAADPRAFVDVDEPGDLTST